MTMASADPGTDIRRADGKPVRVLVVDDEPTRLEAGRPLAHDPVDLTMLVVDTVSDAHAAGPRHDWQLDLPEEPVVVAGDGARLHQVLANLLANARTHTPEGTTVTVGVSSTVDQAVLRVTDTGPGRLPVTAALQSAPEAVHQHVPQIVQ
jgi:two-component system OmpR family sensor kinase